MWMPSEMPSPFVESLLMRPLLEREVGLGPEPRTPRPVRPLVWMTLLLALLLV